MTKFCGWLGDPLTPRPEGEAVTQAMEAALKAAGHDVATFNFPGGGLAHGDLSAFHEKQRRAVIAGSPWWSSPRDPHANGEPAAYLSHDYAARGLDAITSIRGSYASAILDLDEHSAVLAVDRFGIDRMYYSVTPEGTLVFGNSIGAVAAHPHVSTTISNQSLFDFVYFHMVPSPATVFEQIFKLEPGHSLQFSPEGMRVITSWNPDFVDDGALPQDAAERLHECLRAAVERCSPNSGSKVGAFLSGGLDSTTVAGVLSRTQNATSVYSIGFDQQGYDEMPFARLAAKHFSLDLHEYYVTPEDVADAIPKIAKSYPEPFGNSSAVPTYFCARLAADDGVDVLLAGDGGDELFGGNERYARQELFAHYAKIPYSARRLFVDPLFGAERAWNGLWPLRKLRSYIQQANVPMPRRLQTYNFLERSKLSDVFCDSFLESVDSQRPIHELDRVWTRTTSRSMLNQMLYLDWQITLADNDLQKVSRMCELAGVQVAYPMLDDDLVDLSLAIPPKMKLKGSQLRYFFRQSMEGFLPAETLGKSKHGFGLPFGYWLRNSSELQELVYGSLEQLKSRGIIRSAFIDSMVDTHKNDHAGYYGELLWVLTILEQWLQEHS